MSWLSFLLFPWCIVTVIVLWLFLMVLWVGLHCVIVVFPDHTHIILNIRTYILSNNGCCPFIPVWLSPSIKTESTLISDTLTVFSMVLKQVKMVCLMQNWLLSLEYRWVISHEQILKAKPCDLNNLNTIWELDLVRLCISVSLFSWLKEWLLCSAYVFDKPP